MSTDWEQLTRLTGGRPITVERVRLAGSDIAIEGSFEPPPLARLTAEDQVFVAAFVRCHGSIKQMEKFYGVSYPTIKGRLNRIAEQLDFVEISAEPPESNHSAVLERLERGEITAAEAIRLLEKGEDHA